MLPFDTVLSARQAIRQKRISAVELTQAALNESRRLNPTLQAYNSLCDETALAQARAVDAGERTGPLAGVPVALKDNLCTSFGYTTCSSRMLADFRAPYDATVIERLERAGAVFIGKTNLDEFAMGSSTENSATMTTRNPWDVSKVPGGSSGGAAAALAGGTCCAAIGSDTGGSIRQPASLCGVSGMKPTYGRVSRYGVIAYASSLDQIGPFTWDAADMAIVLEVIAGHDPRDSTSVNEPVEPYGENVSRPLSRLRIGIAREFDLPSGIDPAVRAAFAEAVAIYRKLGATIVDVSLPHTDYGIAAYYVIAPCEASSNLARYDGVHFGHRTSEAVNDIVELFSRSRSEGFGDEVKRRIMIGTYALCSGYYDAYYVRALKVKTLIKRDFDQAFADCDVILSPTTPTPAFGIGEKSGDPLAMYLCDVFTVTCNIAGIAGLSIPCGFTSDQKPLPMGLQLLGPNFSEGLLLRAAAMYQRETDWHRRRPSL